MHSFVSWKAMRECVHADKRCSLVSDAPCVCGRVLIDELQAAGPAAVLLQPGQRLLLRIDVTYLLPLRDKVAITSARTHDCTCTGSLNAPTHS